MTKLWPTLLLIPLTFACKMVEDKPAHKPPPPGSLTSAERPIDIAPPVAALRNIARRLPADWSGTGVLTRREAPDGAPDWTAIEAEVVDEGGKRYLRSAGDSAGFRSPKMAHNTAAKRGRAIIADWLGLHHLRVADDTDTYTDDKFRTFVRVRLEVPSDWQPGKPYIPPSLLEQR